jgi:aromatic ring-opening dioxygenase LigB subunit
MKEKKGIIGGCVVPHPPLLIPEIGGRDLARVDSTRRAMQDLARQLKKTAPDVLVMISPHTPMYMDAFGVRLSEEMEGSFTRFGCPHVRLRKKGDLALAQAVLDGLRNEGLPAEPLSRSGGWLSEGEELDHGLLVPLYYLDQEFDTPIVSLAISGLDYRSHFQLGRVVREACERLSRRAVFVASGDLSHRLTPGAPAGYNPRGREFDRLIVEAAESGDFDALYRIDEELVEEAGECGFRSLHAMWGALKGDPLENRVLSYEGPFGVGYMVSLHLRRDLSA